jgi:hypothetical protein
MELHAHRETSSPVSKVFPGSPHRIMSSDSGLNTGISNTSNNPNSRNMPVNFFFSFAGR